MKQSDPDKPEDPCGNICRFPGITAPQALDIVARNCPRVLLEDCRVHAKMPDNFRIYLPDYEPCWFVVIPCAEESTLLTSSRVAVVSRITGKLLYDGSAGDEG